MPDLRALRTTRSASLLPVRISSAFMHADMPQRARCALDCQILPPVWRVHTVKEERMKPFLSLTLLLMGVTIGLLVGFLIKAGINPISALMWVGSAIWLGYAIGKMKPARKK